MKKRIEVSCSSSEVLYLCESRIDSWSSCTWGQCPSLPHWLFLSENPVSLGAVFGPAPHLAPNPWPERNGFGDSQLFPRAAMAAREEADADEEPPDPAASTSASDPPPAASTSISSPHPAAALDAAGRNKYIKDLLEQANTVVTAVTADMARPEVEEGELLHHADELNNLAAEVVRFPVNLLATSARTNIAKEAARAIAALNTVRLMVSGPYLRRGKQTELEFSSTTTAG